MSILNVGIGSSGIDTGDIGHSLRFSASRSCYMSRTSGTSTDTKIATLSFWMKAAPSLASGVQVTVWCSAGNSGIVAWNIGSYGGDLFVRTDGANDVRYGIRFRDPTSWMHYVIAVDTTQATGANRVKVYLNGVLQTASSGTATQNSTSFNASATAYRIMSDISNATYTDGYLSRVCFVDGQALTPSSFITFNTDINEWVSKSQSEVKAVVDAGGTNSFMLDFDNGSSTTTLGYDKSSKGNNWTLNNFSLTAGTNYDWMLDVPGNSFPVINSLVPVNSTAPTISDANLKWTRASTAPGWTAASMPLPQTDKLYWETDHTSSLNGAPLWTGVVNSTRGAADDNANNIAGVQTDTTWNGRLTNGSTIATYLNPGGLNAVVAHAYDGATGKYWCGYVSGGSITWGTNGGVGDPAAGTNALETLSGVVTPAFGQFQTAGATRTITEYFNAGQRPFSASALPTGFKALCQANMPDVPAAYLNPRKHFEAKTRTGTAATYSVTGLLFQPDFVWIKSRGRAVDHALYDSVRGVEKRLESNNTDAEVTGDTTGLTAFNSDGYTGGALDQINGTTATNSFVDWLLKAGGAGVSNTAGSITSTVSANTDSGFSIVTYTGTGANATVGHGCKVNGVATAPGLVIIKCRTSGTTYSWCTYHQNSLSNPANRILFMNNTDAATTDYTTILNSTAPSSTVISVGTATGTNESGKSYVAYCFAPGFFSIGSYTGNGNADGVWVPAGHKSLCVLAKQASGAGGNWILVDSVRRTYNVMETYLNPNLSSVETTGTTLFDNCSSGFKLRSTNFNTASETYVYLSIPDVFAKFSLAR